MAKYVKVDVTEKQLEDLLRRYSDSVEKGLQYVDHQRMTTRGPLDVIFIDSGNSLVVAELKIVEDDSMLVQGIDYYDFVNINLEAYSRIYKDFKINPRAPVRLFLIAPSFSIDLINRIKWIDIPISLFTYQCLEFKEPKKEIIPIFNEITPPSIPKLIEEYDIQDRYNYIINNKMRELAIKTIEEIQEWNLESISIEPTKSDISIKTFGSVIAYLAPRREYFVIYTYNEDGDWKPFKIEDEEDKINALSVVKDVHEKV